MTYQTCINWSWNDVLLLQSTEQIWRGLNDTVLQLFDIYVPKTQKSNKKYPIWLTPEIVSLLIKKHLWKLFEKWGLLHHKDTTKKLSSELRSLIRREFNLFVTRSQIEMKTSPSKFWTYVNSNKQTSRIPGQMKLHIVDDFA